jgi:hypothetical protein
MCERSMRVSTVRQALGHRPVLVISLMATRRLNRQEKLRRGLLSVNLYLTPISLWSTDQRGLSTSLL